MFLKLLFILFLIYIIFVIVFPSGNGFQIGGEDTTCAKGAILNKDGYCEEVYETTDEDYSRYETDLITATR